ncbi:protein kinase domain-containing protein [Micromonospora sp. NPDC003197]
MLCSGVVLSDRYRLDERLATGGMGDVWRATDLLLDREVAVKILLPSLLTDPTFIARFRAEAKMMAALHHPGIVRVYDVGEDPNAPGGSADYLVMEYVHGEPLNRRIEAAGQLDVPQTLSVLAQAADALHAAHEKGIVHRDVKPSNLLVQPNGSVVLVDFGVARSSSVTSITSANGIPGTALYMAPEQASGRPVSAATDIYALGAVAYCCLAGAPPFTGDTPLEVAVRHLDEMPPPLPAEVPAPVAELIMRALAKDPAERYPTAAAFAAAARALSGEELTTTTGAGGFSPIAAGMGAKSGPDTLTELPVVAAPPPRTRSRRATLLSVAGAVVLGLAGLTAALGLGRDTGGSPADQNSPSAPAVSTPTSRATSPGVSTTGSTGRNLDPSLGSSASPTAQPSPSAEPSTDPSTPASNEPTPPPASTTSATPSRTPVSPGPESTTEAN